MRFRVHLATASAFLVLAIWLSSGTMTPYASTFFRPIVSTPCGYLYNVDHAQYEAAFQMLDGQPRERWQSSLVLRRLLFPLVAYPFMKAAGFELGGFIASLLVHVAALIALASFLRRRHGEEAAQVGMWLYATTPGITYWAALPYSNLTVVPASVGLYILLTQLDERRGMRQVSRICVGMGILFTAYDLLPFFATAALFVLLRRRRFAESAVAVPCLAAAPLLVSLLLKLVFHVPWTSSNTSHYGTILDAYLHPPAVGVWLASLSHLPLDLLANYFYSNMLFLPALFLVLLAVTRQPLTLVEGALLGAVALVFLFNNLAPPYEDRWQMRGTFIPRLYQPLCVVLLGYAARTIGAWRSVSPARARLLFAASVLAVVGNVSIVFGPIGRVPWAGYVYHRFYVHSSDNAMDVNLAIHGRRPLGFCKPGHHPASTTE